MTKEERAARAEERRAARAEAWRQELKDKELVLDALRDILRDRTCNPAQRLYAVACLNYICGYRFVPCDLKFPDTKDDSDMTRLRARFAAELKNAAKSST